MHHGDFRSVGVDHFILRVPSRYDRPRAAMERMTQWDLYGNPACPELCGLGIGTKIAELVGIDPNYGRRLDENDQFATEQTVLI